MLCCVIFSIEVHVYIHLHVREGKSVAKECNNQCSMLRNLTMFQFHMYMYHVHSDFPVKVMRQYVENHYEKSQNVNLHVFD